MIVCKRCREDFGVDREGNQRTRCRNCGVHKDRIVASRNSLRRRNIGGKRGRNSGVTNKSKSKGGTKK